MEKKKKKSRFEEQIYCLMEQSYKRFRLRECTKENPKSRSLYKKTQNYVPSPQI
jgi:hypothetical protein